MGNCSGSEQLKHLQMENLVRIQIMVKNHLARKRMKEVRVEKLKSLFAQSSSTPKTSTRTGSSIGPCFSVSDDEINKIVTESGANLVYIDTFCTVANGMQYKGTWKKSPYVKHGLGIQLWPDGSKYEGMWKDGKMCGRGRMTHSNGDIYEGEWSNDMANGFGKFLEKSGASYTGQWENDMQHGEGIETWDEGRTKYQGTFWKGKKNGRGRFEWEDGSFYQGEFVDGAFSGHGRYYFADLDKTYEGEFRNSNMEGRGTENWADGRKYEGEFKNGKKDGEGTFVWPNGNKYIGSWRQDKMHGTGIYCDQKEGSKRQGEWLMGKRQQWIRTIDQTPRATSPSRRVD